MKEILVILFRQIAIIIITWLIVIIFFTSCSNIKQTKPIKFKLESKLDDDYIQHMQTLRREIK